MSKGTLPRSRVENWKEDRAEWLEAAEQIVAEAESWAAKRGWWVEREMKDVSDDQDRIGTYQVPMLRIQTPNLRLIFEPIARYVVGARGRVDLAVFPSYHSLAIVRRDDGWRIVDDANRSTAWSEKAFVKAAAQLAGKA